MGFVDMMIQCDDELYRLDRTWLGPKGKSLPLKETYRMYVLWGVATLAMLVVYRMIGLPWHVVGLIVLVGAGYGVAKWLDRRLTADRPLIAEVERLWTELSAPRPAAEVVRVWQLSARVDRWGPGAPLPRRWWSRLADWVSRVTHPKSGKIYVGGEWRNVR